MGAVRSAVDGPLAPPSWPHAARVPPPHTPAPNTTCGPSIHAGGKAGLGPTPPFPARQSAKSLSYLLMPGRLAWQMAVQPQCAAALRSSKGPGVENGGPGVVNQKGGPDSKKEGALGSSKKQECLEASIALCARERAVTVMEVVKAHGGNMLSGWGGVGRGAQTRPNSGFVGRRTKARAWQEATGGHRERVAKGWGAGAAPRVFRNKAAAAPH